MANDRNEYSSQPAPAAGYGPVVTNAAPPPAPAPVVTQPVVVQQPVEPRHEAREDHPSVTIYSHSALFYWWPVWVCGYVMALITYLYGERYQIGADWEMYHPSSNLGVIFFMTLALVILVTNVRVRGLASALVVVSAVLVAVVLAYFSMWDQILGWFGDLKIHLNLGAYFWFSTLVFLIWAVTVFIVDRMSYWYITPGQVTHKFVLGASSRSYDTDNMVLQKHRDDFFRHWVLGFGAGDLHIQPFGARAEEISIPNVLFIGHKIHAIQHMIATEPEAFGHAAIE